MSQSARLPVCGLKVGRGKHCCLRCKCRSKGCHCCACLSEGVCEGGGSLVDCRHERVHGRTTGQCTDRHFDADIDVRISSKSTAQLFSWVGGWCRRTCEPSAGNFQRMQDFSPSSRAAFLHMSLMLLEGPSWEAMWPCRCVPEISQMRATARAWNDATECGHCELFFFLMKPRKPLT